MSFDKKFSELSQEEQREAKDEYGSRQGWQDAKSRAQGFQNREDQVANRPAPAAPPSPTQQALNNEHTPKANDVGQQSKPAPSQSYNAAPPAGQAKGVEMNAAAARPAPAAAPTSGGSGSQQAARPDNAYTRSVAKVGEKMSWDQWRESNAPDMKTRTLRNNEGEYQGYSHDQKKGYRQYMTEYDKKYKTAEREGWSNMAQAAAQERRGMYGADFQAGQERARQWQKDESGFQSNLRDWEESRTQYHTDKDGNKHSYFSDADKGAMAELRQSREQGKDNYIRTGESWDPTELFNKYGIDVPGVSGAGYNSNPNADKFVPWGNVSQY